MSNDIPDWIDSQTAENKPAILLIYEEDEDSGFIYAANAPAFGCPAIIALDVPRQQAMEVGAHLNFLVQDHIDGKVVQAEQTTAQQHDSGYAYFRLTKPSAALRRKLMREELAQTRRRWPKAEVLLLEAKVPFPSHTVH